MKCKEKLFITLLVFLLSLTSVYAGGIELGAYLGESNGVELGFTFGKNNHWVTGAMLGSHSVLQTIETSSSSSSGSYGSGSSSGSSPQKKNTISGGAGLYFGRTFPILFLKPGPLEFGVEPALKLFATWNSYTRYSSDSSSYSGNPESSHFSAPDIGLAFNLNLLGRIGKFDLTMGYKGEIHFMEGIASFNESIYKSAFNFAFRYHFTAGRGSASLRNFGDYDDYDDSKYDAVRILPIPGTNIPSYQRIAE